MPPAHALLRCASPVTATTSPPRVYHRDGLAGMAEFDQAVEQANKDYRRHNEEAIRSRSRMKATEEAASQRSITVPKRRALTAQLGKLAKRESKAAAAAYKARVRGELAVKCRDSLSAALNVHGYAAENMLLRRQLGAAKQALLLLAAKGDEGEGESRGVVAVRVLVCVYGGLTWLRPHVSVSWMCVEQQHARLWQRSKPCRHKRHQETAATLQQPPGHGQRRSHARSHGRGPRSHGPAPHSHGPGRRSHGRKPRAQGRAPPGHGQSLASASGPQCLHAALLAVWMPPPRAMLPRVTLPRVGKTAAPSSLPTLGLQVTGTMKAAATLYPLPSLLWLLTPLLAPTLSQVTWRTRDSHQSVRVWPACLVSGRHSGGFGNKSSQID